MVPAIKMNPEQGRAEKAVLRHVSDLPRFGRCCGPPSCERRAALHWFELSRRKIFDRRARRRSSGNCPASLNFDKRSATVLMPFMGLMPRNSTLVVRGSSRSSRRIRSMVSVS